MDLPHHDGSPAYVETQAATLGDAVGVRVRVPAGAGVSSVHVRSVRDGEPAFTEARREAEHEAETWWRAEVAAVNPDTRYRFLLDGPGGYRWLTAAGVVGHEVTDATDFRLVTYPPPPAWAADAVCYQIFPDRFSSSGAVRQWPAWAEPATWAEPVARGGSRAMRQCYGGDLPGVTARLDHLTALGVDTVYLTPVFPAPSNHRYNASAFDHVDPLLGGDEALAELSAALHARGMRLLGDLTLNHSGDTHAWFQAAKADPDALEAGFYHFRRHPDAYRSWLDESMLPTFDHASAELRRRLYEGPDSVVAQWLRPPFSLDGWRVDVANMAGRDGDADHNAALATTMAATMRAVNPEALLIAEHSHDASADLSGSGWHGTMNYAGFTRPVWQWLIGGRAVDFLGAPVPVPRLGGPAVAAAMDAFRAAVPWRVTLHNVNQLDSHDTARFRTVAGSTAGSVVGAALLLTFPGIPMIFAGDELGLEGIDNEAARAPMPWAATGTGVPGWDHAILEAYRDLIALRREHPALRHGGFRWVHVGADSMAYLRELAPWESGPGFAGGERLLVHLARAGHGPIQLPATALGATAAIHLYAGPDLRATHATLTLPATTGPEAHIWRLA